MSRGKSRVIAFAAGLSVTPLVGHGAWSGFQVLGPGVPVPGYTANAGTTGPPDYVSPDGEFVLVTDSAGGKHIASRTWDPGTGLWGSPVALPGSFSVNSTAGYLSPDGNTLVYAAPGGDPSDIWRAQWSGTEWADHAPIPGADTPGPEGHPVFNGLQLYFALGEDDVWCADYNPIGDEFSPPSPASINTSAKEKEPWVSTDGLLIIFESNRPNGHGGFDLWYATRTDPADPWSTASNLGPYVNTAGNEALGRIAEDAGLLFFSRGGVAMQAEVTVPPTLGDVSGDGNADNLDITPFTFALMYPEHVFDAMYPDGAYWGADVNEDANVDNLDITPFVELLMGGGQRIPEPAALCLLAFGVVAVMRRRRHAWRGASRGAAGLL